MKKLILTLIILMVAGFIFAGADEETSGESLEINKTGLPIVAEKITLDVVTVARVHHGDFAQMEFLLEMEEKTNVHLEIEAVPQASYPEKKNLKLASGDLPDAFVGLAAVTPSDIVQYGSQGVFIPLEDLIEEILHQDGDVRLPGDRRLELREKAHLNGISLTDKQYQEIVSLSRRKKVNQ